MAEATVIVPAYEHALTLRPAVQSALAQTVADLDVVIVGDGVTDATRATIEDLLASDPRVRFRDHPKSPGHGFAYKHQAVQEARAEVICYLSDDDLWFPEHVAAMRELLEGADFGAAATIGIRHDGPIIKRPRNLGLRHFRALVRGGERAILQLSAVAHTASAYARTPQGWLVEDPDYYAVWAQFAARRMRMASTFRPSVLQFPSPRRTEMSAAERAAELERWRLVFDDCEARLELMETILAREIRRGARLTQEAAELRAAPKTAGGRRREAEEDPDPSPT
jgi:GalNAc5-diNAcBac-PP-undecaprenol beta-1,3-glucosyltransferase